MTKSRKFQFKLGLLIFLVIGLFAVSVMMTFNKATVGGNVLANNKQEVIAIDKQSNMPNTSATQQANNPNTTGSDRSIEQHTTNNQDGFNAPEVSQRRLIAGDWVVVDCAQKIIAQCPHQLLVNGQTPDYIQQANVSVYRGRCRDVSIQIDSFCIN